MTKLLKPLPLTPYDVFRRDLESECPRAAYWLESMIFGIMAQMDDMTEERALELACKIVLKANTSRKNTVQPGRGRSPERMPADPANVCA